MRHFFFSKLVNTFLNSNNQYIKPKKLEFIFRSSSLLVLSSSSSSWTLLTTSSIVWTLYHYISIYSIFGSLGRVSKFIFCPQPTLFFFTRSSIVMLFTTEVLVGSFLVFCYPDFSILNCRLFLSRVILYLKTAFFMKSKAQEGRLPHEVFGQASILNHIKLHAGLGHFFIKSLISSFEPVA